MSSSSERPKVWEELTDEEIMEAVRFACRGRLGKRADGSFATSGSVQDALSQPNVEQWPDGGPNALLGLGLIPKFGPGSPPRGAITRRLKRMVASGQLRPIKLVTPRGNNAPDGYAPIEKGSQ